MLPFAHTITRAAVVTAGSDLDGLAAIVRGGRGQGDGIGQSSIERQKDVHRVTLTGAGGPHVPGDGLVGPAPTSCDVFGWVTGRAAVAVHVPRRIILVVAARTGGVVPHGDRKV